MAQPRRFGGAKELTAAAIATRTATGEFTGSNDGAVLLRGTVCVCRLIVAALPSAHHLRACGTTLAALKVSATGTEPLNDLPAGVVFWSALGPSRDNKSIFNAI